jgi:hypothetical protein
MSSLGVWREGKEGRGGVDVGVPFYKVGGGAGWRGGSGGAP